MRKRRA